MTTQASTFAVAVPSVTTPFRSHRNPFVVRAQGTLHSNAVLCLSFFPATQFLPIRFSTPQLGLSVAPQFFSSLVFFNGNIFLVSAEPSDKSVEIMRKFSEQYARKSGTYFCVDKGVTSVVIKTGLHVEEKGNKEGIAGKVYAAEKRQKKRLLRLLTDRQAGMCCLEGLADHKDTLGAPLCPCRHYDDKAAEVAQGFWNCPCVPMRERKECHCMLFLTPDNDFAGNEQTITLDEIKESTANM
ncbi:Ferredoxin-thioredoxin reductase catalytic chain, chloroplastic [Glycine soja]|uniref:Ferredoxin-thioredoxin reductase catalytic chain, chloroplastic n=1 Tax=Glycine soja TaxID=3848 RepID=A0A445FAY2_GLYSO|nr:Ferredoxin-thioredoxin reductase catalytic chain, chloroplastic [Glycine soja]